MNESTVQDYSAQYYAVRYHGYGLRYHTDLIRWLMQNACGKILDAGCGTGIVSQLYPDLDILGIDISPAMLQQHPGRAIHQDVCHLPADWENTFDFVLCRSLLHHLPQHQQGLANLARVLKPSGQIAFLETNKSMLATWIRARTQHGDRFSEYHHSFTDTNLLVDIGQWFTITEVKYIGFISYPLWGFRDIIDFQRWIPFKSVTYRTTHVIDEFLSKIPWIRSLSWAIGIKATKN